MTAARCFSPSRSIRRNEARVPTRGRATSRRKSAARCPRSSPGRPAVPGCGHISPTFAARPSTASAIASERKRVTSDIFGSHTQAELAAYGQSEQQMGNARVSGGARLDFLAVDGGSLTAVASPRIGVTIPTDGRGHDGGVLRASIGRGFRAPTIAERFVHTFALGFEVIPNPNLRPETAWSFEVGHTTGLLLRFLRLDAALFWTEAQDLIEPALLTPSDTIQLQNVVRARLAGIDATIIGAPIPNRLITTLGADYTVGNLGVGADFRFASRPERIELEGFVDPRRVPVKVLDLRAGWSRGPVEFRLLVANALNYIYNLVPETLAPVRTVTLTAVWAH